VSLGLILRRLDYSLLLAVFGIAAVGMATIESATRLDEPGDPDYYTTRHLVYLVAGGSLGLVAAFVPPHVYRRLAWPIYALTIVGLVVVLGFSAARGSTRWISLGEFNLQPSEIGKVALVVALAALVARRSRQRPGAWSTVLLVGLVTLPLFALVFVQPDLGTATVYLAIAATVLFIGGMRATQFATLVIVAVAISFLVFSVLPAAGVEVLRDYQVARVTGFLDDDSSAAYQTTQSKIAIGSGGLLGKGADGATQTSGDFLPEHHTDFVFSVVGEQRGFLGAALVLALYIVVIWRAIRTITLAATVFESLLAAGLAGMLLTQIFVNVAMVTGLAPTTGIPLPFMTYGGSNTLTNLIGIGLLCAVQIRGGVPEPPPLATHEVVVNTPAALRKTDGEPARRR
jgi:rod shape determining protein RodA